MDESENIAVEEAFWRFSLEFYERPRVAEALIALQERDGLDVNLILFALWLGGSGRGILHTDLLTAAEREAAALRTELVEPLRQLRRKLQHHPDSGVQRLREEVKALELAAEKLVQTRLARLAGKSCLKASAEGRRATARANLALYLGTEAMRSGDAAVILSEFDEFARPY